MLYLYRTIIITFIFFFISLDVYTPIDIDISETLPKILAHGMIRIIPSHPSAVKGMVQQKRMTEKEKKKKGTTLIPTQG